MKTTLKISQTVIERISELQKACHGKLFGNFSKNNLTILALQVDLESGNNLVNSLPAEIDFCGIFRVSDEKPNHSWITDYAKGVDVTDNPIFINFDLTSKKLESFIITSDKLEVLTYSSLKENDINSQFVHLLLRGSLPLKCEASKKSVEETFAEIRKVLTTGKIAFNLEKSNILLLENEFENPIIGTSGENLVSELCLDNNEQNEGSKKKKNQLIELQILNVNLLKRNTKLDSENDVKNHAPLCVFSKNTNKAVKHFNITLNINALSIVNKQSKISNLYGILVESTIRYLRLYENVLQNCLSENKDNITEIKFLDTFHFYPECNHFVTKIYPSHLEENQLKKDRQLLHEELLVKSEFPKFRRANVFDFDSMSNKGNSPLINPHESVKNTDNGGHLALVKGKYQYYHYCQDRMDDNGWGCAYRSLQTLASWFKLQGFVNKNVPTFKEIQKTLVDIGDKPRNFIDSRQWIGSTEVSFVLNTFMGVTSKILFVSSGEEMSTKGPELVAHFENHGSPIMIGGGVLAHTILGVDYNRDTGSLKFLILDPHYTGGEDIHTIVTKGWCGWKNIDFWDKKAHYNMCLPQVPREI